ncbi:streptophobe family protein [Streptomyces sp. MUM 203J]|uniref:streptophobe family protein n=1 Tax=Streptomyces sp. MUM 203J TaxID=2791990 RepID=UPI001F033A5F|nr:streptophobe family protein [Streptomyces sp. MUM 203J]
MSSRDAAVRKPAQGSLPHALHDWRDALGAVLAGLAAMVVTAVLGLWAAGATDLPGGAFPRVVAATVVMAAGGDVGLTGEAGALAGADAEVTAMPLSVSLAGALALGAGFLRPLRHRAVASGRELLGRIGRTVLLWLAGLAGVAALARHTFTDLVPEEGPAGTVSDLLGDLFGDAASPTVGFGAEYGATLLYGLLWVLGVLAMALLVSRRAPLPARLVRYQEPVRPAAFAMLFLLLAYVVVGLVTGLVVAAVKGHTADTFAVLLLGLPNLVWMALGLGVFGSWEGRVDGPFGLPMPQVLDQVLRGEEVTTLDVRSLAEYDGRAWWLVPAAAVLLLAAAFVMAVRSPARTRLWQQALHMGVAFALTLLVIAPVTRLHARFGLSLLGIFEIEALGGEVLLSPHLWRMVGLALLWGLVAGFLGGLLASRVRRRGEVPDRPEDPQSMSRKTGSAQSGGDGGGSTGP